MSKKNIQMKVLGSSGYEDICPVPAGHASSHGKNGTDPITLDLIGAQSEIPITSEIPVDANIWIDPNEDGDGSWYTKEETNGLLDKKADLDSNGKVLSTQLPDMDYIPNSAKGANNGVATLDNSGKVPSTQLPDMDYIPNSAKGSVNGVATLGSDGRVPSTQLPAMNYAPSTHASQHATGGSDPITPASIGAATSDHTHSNYAASSHNHAASEITSGTLGVARGGTGKSSVTSGNFLVGNGTSALTEKTPAQVLSAIGAAASSHNHSASNITSGTLDTARIPTLAASKVTTGTFAATDIKAANGTDYTTARIRNIQASTTDLTAGSSSLANGDIYLVYE